MRFLGQREWGFNCRALPVCALILVIAATQPSAASTNLQQNKTAWNDDGGIFVTTEGDIPDGPCFKVSLRVNSAHFFDDLKRTEVDGKTVFRRGQEVFTEFPGKLALSFSIRDLPCTVQLQPVPQTYLTPEIVGSLRLSFFWKHGIALQPVQHVTRISSKVERIPPYAAELADTLPEKFEWFTQFEVPSAGIPLTDSLVLVFRTADGKIAARVAARL